MNHFLSLEKDDDCNVWIVIHSGTRSMGKYIFDYYMNIAANSNKFIYDYTRSLVDYMISVGNTESIQHCFNHYYKSHIDDTPFLSGYALDDYINDVKMCTEWVYLSHLDMVSRLSSIFSFSVQDTVHSTHNYVDFKNKIVRKGAIELSSGQRGIIPINMRDGSLIVVGKGNEDWLNSGPHGAGRILGRRAAAKTIDFDDYKNSMDGIYSTCVSNSTIDESPMCYKPIELIIDSIAPTADIVKRLTPIYNFKG